MQQANRDGLGPNWRISDQKNLGTDSGCNVVENVDLLTIDLTIIFCLYNPVVDHDVIFGEDLSQLGLKLPHWVIKASICPCEPEDGQLGGLLQSSEELSCMGVANEIYGLGLLQPLLAKSSKSVQGPFWNRSHRFQSMAGSDKSLDQPIAGSQGQLALVLLVQGNLWPHLPQLYSDPKNLEGPVFVKPPSLERQQAGAS